jgi:hypothetical protein
MVCDNSASGAQCSSLSVSLPNDHSPMLIDICEISSNHRSQLEALNVRASIYIFLSMWLAFPDFGSVTVTSEVQSELSAQYRPANARVHAAAELRPLHQVPSILCSPLPDDVESLYEISENPA